MSEMGTNTNQYCLYCISKIIISLFISKIHAYIVIPKYLFSMKLGKEVGLSQSIWATYTLDCSHFMYETNWWAIRKACCHLM